MRQGEIGHGIAHCLPRNGCQDDLNAILPALFGCRIALQCDAVLLGQARIFGDDQMARQVIQRGIVRRLDVLIQRDDIAGGAMAIAMR